MRVGAATDIDAVITWVDPNDPRWRQDLRRFADASDPNHIAGGPRFRDGGLLRFCLRSIHAHLPWLRSVILVTAGQRPSWLRHPSPGVRLVSHGEIFPDRNHLPTFNSLAIESHLHRIAGLSEIFLYFNDDMFVLKPTAASRFITDDGGHLLPFEFASLPADSVAATIYERSLAFTNRLLNAQFPARATRMRIPHLPYVFSRSWFAQLWSVWPDALERTSATRFRSAASVALNVLYYHAVREWPRDDMPEFAVGCSYPSRVIRYPKHSYIPVSRDGTSRPLAADLMKAAYAELVCLNDNTTNAQEAAHGLALMRQWLGQIFPHPAPWETAP